MSDSSDDGYQSDKYDPCQEVAQQPNNPMIASEYKEPSKNNVAIQVPGFGFKDGDSKMHEFEDDLDTVVLETGKRVFVHGLSEALCSKHPYVQVFKVFSH